MIKEEPGPQTTEKERVEYRPERTDGAGAQTAPEPAIDEIKATIAETVRKDNRERAALTPSDVVFALVPDNQQQRITAILDEMAADDRFADIKAVTTASGMVFFVSTTYIGADEAIAKSRIEEVKSLFAEKVRADSRDSVALSSAVDLQALAPEMEPAGIAAILDDMGTDERYADIKAVTSSTGDVYYHSDRHMSGYYALVLTRVLAKDPCATIAATVRDESMIYPRPTCVLVFAESPFQIPLCDLRSVVEDMLRKPEFADIKMMVHPETGGVYLYSSQFLGADAAYEMMHWVEVVKDANP